MTGLYSWECGGATTRSVLYRDFVGRALSACYLVLEESENFANMEQLLLHYVKQLLLHYMEQLLLHYMEQLLLHYMEQLLLHDDITVKV